MSEPDRGAPGAGTSREDQAQPSAQTPTPLAVVGVGASAGGLDAFKRFLQGMPADTGLAFVLVPHLDPSHESLMAELLSRCTAMPVVEAEDGMAIAPDRVYVIPPNRYLAVDDGLLHLSALPHPQGRLTAIDSLLRSLAHAFEERAIDDAAIKRDGGFVPVEVRVKPVLEPDAGEGLLLVIFADRQAHGQTGAEVEHPRETMDESSLVQHLDLELKATGLSRPLRDGRPTTKTTTTTTTIARPLSLAMITARRSEAQPR